MKCGLVILQRNSNVKAMENTKKIKVVWICAVSNSDLRERLKYHNSWFNRFAFRLMGVDVNKKTDVAIWNTNGLLEFESFHDIELHVVCMTRFLNSKRQTFDKNTIHYHFLRDQNSSCIRFLFHQLFTRNSSRFHKNRRLIKKELELIKPDVVHIIGPENPYYSLALLDISSQVPTIVQLQALLDRIKDVTRVDEEKKAFRYKGGVERDLFLKASYIGTTLKDFRDYIINNINPSARFLDLSLPMAQTIDLSECKKEYDFVYFASDISKAGEEAIQTFSLIHQRHPDLTLDVVGGYDPTFKTKLDAIIRENGMQQVVFFEGRLPSHDDVIKQIRKARFALIPLKMDFVPNTIRESMANGLPVITTITDGTPRLNLKRESVLLSPQDDFEAMANNVELLLKDHNYAYTLRENAALTERERSNNHDIMDKWRMAYRAIVLNEVIDEKDVIQLTETDIV